MFQVARVRRTHDSMTNRARLITQTTLPQGRRREAHNFLISCPVVLKGVARRRSSQCRMKKGGWAKKKGAWPKTRRP
jgi:hypothetical protein